MSFFPAHFVGSYVGTGAALVISDPGFRPSFVRIYNDTDNDILFDYFDGQANGIAVKSGAAVLTPTALALTFVGSTPAFTGNAPAFTGNAPAFTGGTPGFTGSAPYTPATSAVTHDAAPGGNPIYLKYAAGRAYLACNMAIDTVNKAVPFSSGKLLIMHDASAASGGLPVQCTDLGVLELDNTLTGADEFLPLIGGGLLKVAHNATPVAQPINFDDGADERLECAFADLTTHNLTSEAQGWQTKTPAGTNAQVTGTVAAVTGSVAAVTGSVAQVTGTVTGNSGGSIGTSVSEVSSEGITLNEKGFSLGSDSSINETGKTYRYIVMR